MALWTEPTLHWQSAVDSVSRHRELVLQGELLTRWPALPFETAPTDCLKIGSAFWIWQPGVGGIRFTDEQPTCDVYPDVQGDRDWFTRVITRSWLPAAYQVWGRQALHASAVARVDQQRAIAFSGPSGAGKSTLAFALARRPGWGHLCDDTLVFSCRQGAVDLHPLQGTIRLRPATAAFFSAEPEAEAGAWPSVPLTLSTIYFVRVAEDDSAPAATIAPLRAFESYPKLLSEANSITLSIPLYNQQLMRDYLHLVANVPAFLLSYRRSFDVIDEILDVIEDHQRAQRAQRAELANLG